MKAKMLERQAKKDLRLKEGGIGGSQTDSHSVAESSNITRDEVIEQEAEEELDDIN